MPLTKYQVRNEYSLADPELFRAADKDDPEALLEGVAMAGLVGVLRQLGDLAEFAAEIFHDLHEEVMATAARGHGLMVRVQQLEAEFPLIEKAFLCQTNHSSFFYNAGIDWHPNLRADQNLITKGDLPRFVMDSYEECRGPPRLFLLDKFDIAGAGACLKRYTDPSFFKVESSSSGVVKYDIQREKKIRKGKKKGSRWRNGETPEVLPASHAKLHQLFLVERVENGSDCPARLVKLKRRQLNESPFDSKTGRSYMEKFLETQAPEHEVVREISVSPPSLKLASSNTSEQGPEILEISTVSSSRESLQRKTPSPSTEEKVQRSFMDDVTEAVIGDGAITKVAESNSDGGTDKISSIYKVVDEKEVQVDRESKTEGSLDGYHSDDVASEMDNFVDALTTMESEMETDTENKPKNNAAFFNIKKHGTDSDANEEHQEHDAFSDSQSIGGSTASGDGSSLFKKGRSSISNSDALSNLAENSPSDGNGAVEVFPYTDIHLAEIVDVPSKMLSINESNTKSHEHVVSSDTCTEVTDIPGYMSEFGEASCNSCVTDLNFALPPVDPGRSLMEVSTVEPELDVTSSNCIKAGTEFSSTDDNETDVANKLSSAAILFPSQTGGSFPSTVSEASNLLDEFDGGDPNGFSDPLLHPSNISDLDPGKGSSDKCDLPSQTENDFLLLATSETCPVDKVDGGNPNVFSDVLQHMPNASDLALEKKSSDNFANAVLQTECASDSSTNFLVHGKIDSAEPIATPAEEQLLGSTLPGLLPEHSRASIACHADVKPVCAVSGTDDIVPENGVNLQNSTTVLDMPQTLSSPKQRPSEITDGGQQHEHDFTETGVSSSEKKMKSKGGSGAADEDETHRSTCNGGQQPQHVSSSGEKMKLEGNAGAGVEDEMYGSTCKEDTVGSPTVPIEFSSDHPNSSGIGNHILSSDMAIETIKVETVAGGGAGANGEDNIPSNNPFCPVPKDLLHSDDIVAETVHSESVAVAAVASGAGEKDDFPPDYSKYPDPEDLHLDDVQSKPLSSEHLVAAAAVDDDVNDAICSSSELICSPSRNMMNLQESLSSFEASHEKGLEVKKAISPEYVKELDDPEEVNQQAVALTGFNSLPCNIGSYAHSNSELLDDVPDSSLADQCQDSLHLADGATTPVSNQISQDMESQVLRRSNIVEETKDLVSSPSYCFTEPGIPLQQVLELQAQDSSTQNLHADEASTSVMNLQFPQVHASNQVELERCFDASSVSSRGGFSIERSIAEVPPKSAGRKFESSEHAVDPLEVIFPNFGLLPEPVQINVEGTPPLPPLPPMQWRMGKLQHPSLATEREVVQYSLDSYPPIPPPANEMKTHIVFPALEGVAMQAGNHVLPVSAVVDEKSANVSEKFSGNQVRPIPVSLQMPTLVNHESSLHSFLPLEETQSLNLLTLSSISSSEKPQHDLLVSEGEMVQPSLNPFLPVQTVEDMTSRQAPVSLDGQAILPLEHLVPEPDLENKKFQCSYQNSEGETKNLPQASVPTVEDGNSKHAPASLQEQLVETPHQLAPEPSLEDKMLQGTRQNSERDPSETLVPQRIMGDEQPKDPFLTSKEETEWLLSSGDVAPDSVDGKLNGNPKIKLPRPHDPLIEAVAAHDKRTLRKVTERVRPQIGPKVDERDSLLEQIRAKSFSLKPAVVTRPNIQGPRTNLKVAAILEKANAIRQALAGSDEDDDEDSWSDS